MFMKRNSWMQSLDLKPSVRAPANSPKAENDARKFGWERASLRRDLATLGRILADEYMGSDSTQGISDQDQNHTATANEVCFDNTESRNVNVHIYGDTAIVTARSTFKGRNRSSPVAGLYEHTDVFVRRRGTWIAVGSHMTALKRNDLRLTVGRFVDRLKDWTRLRTP